MDLWDTFTESQKEAMKEANEREKTILERLKELQEKLRASEDTVKELSKKNEGSFTLDSTSDTAKAIRTFEDSADKVITKVVEKSDLKLDDLNLVFGMISAVEKYRAMKINVYSMTKFRYPTGGDGPL